MSENISQEGIFWFVFSIAEFITLLYMLWGWKGLLKFNGELMKDYKRLSDNNSKMLDMITSLVDELEGPPEHEQ